MRLTVTKATLSSYVTIIRYGFERNFEENLVKCLVRTSLESLILKLSKVRQRLKESANVQISIVEAQVLKWIAECYNEDHPDNVHYFIVLEWINGPLEQEAIQLLHNLKTIKEISAHGTEV